MARIPKDVLHELTTFERPNPCRHSVPRILQEMRKDQSWKYLETTRIAQIWKYLERTRIIKKTG
jgi:hypothetical protein